MENASKALIIAGAILLSILIIAIGIYIFNGANSTITDSMSSMSTQEIEAFNNQFTQYEGTQSGSNVKYLIGKLIANASTYKQELNKLPAVDMSKTIYDKYSSKKIKDKPVRPSKSTDAVVGSYFTRLGVLRSVIEDKHQYIVKMELGSNGLIDKITILYSESDPMS